MKLVKKFLRAIHSWPEEARRLWAGILVGVMAVFLLAVWGAVMPSRLQNMMSVPEPVQESENWELPPGILESLWKDLNSAAASMGAALKEIMEAQ